MKGMKNMKSVAVGLVCLVGAACLADAPAAGREWADAGKNFKAEDILKGLPPGTRHQGAFVPMRDGARMATEVFLPPGDGPFPAILIRTPYGRQGAAGYSSRYKDSGCAFVVQDTRGRGDSEGKIGLANENEIDDGYDTIDWLAKQPWCNGRIGMVGGSGHGMAARMAFLARHPALVVVGTGNTAGNTCLYWSFENGVRRWMHGWCDSFRNLRKGPVPTLPPAYDLARWQTLLADAAKDNPTVLFLDDGWYNIFGDGGAIDDFIAFGKTCRVYGEVAPRTHGAMTFGLQFPKGPRPKAEPVPSFIEILKGAEAKAPSRLFYFVMGDVKDAATPGNRWAVTDVWPPKGSVPRKFFLSADGKVTDAAPTAAAASLAYCYDPKDPAPSRGGGYTYAGKAEADSSGALDQRPIHDRQDVLRFYSEPLAEPLTVVGKLAAELHFTADVPDTTLIVKLVDVYPDGFEMIVREGAAMARYRNGFDQPVPLVKGEPTNLAFEFNSTAIVFNRGHRIGIFVTSSSVPAYEPHPNVYEPVLSCDLAQPANISILLEQSHPSHVILPVMP
jgi:predicted acyl esterase